MKYRGLRHNLPSYLLLMSLYSLSSQEKALLELERPFLTKAEQQAYRNRKPLHEDQKALLDNMRNGRGIAWSSVKTGATDFADETGTTPLMLASLFGEADYIEQLLSIESSSDYINRQNNEGRNALMLAAMGGHTDIIGCLSAYHALLDYNIRDNRGLTALGLAVMCNRRSAAKLLIPKTILDTEVLGAAVENKSLSMLTLLLKRRRELSREQKEAINLDTLLKRVDGKIDEVRLQLGGLYGKDYGRAIRVRKRLEKMQDLLIHSGAKRSVSDNACLFVHTDSADSSASPQSSPSSSGSSTSLSTSPELIPSPADLSLFAGLTIRDGVPRARSRSMSQMTDTSCIEFFIPQ